MKNIVVIVPTGSESKVIVHHGIRVTHCGVGMAECAAATARIIADGKPDLIILAGTAGTYTESIAVGETVAVASEIIADLGRWSASGEDGKMAFTPLFQRKYPASIVPEGIRVVHSYTTDTAGGCTTRPVEAEIENMEGAAFFAVCDKLNVPAMEIRTVSNIVGESITGRNMEIAVNRLALDLENILSSLA